MQAIAPSSPTRRPGVFPALMAALVATGLWLGGCSTADDVMFKTLAGEAPGEKGTIPPAVAAGPVGIGPPALGSTIFRRAKRISRKPKARAPLPRSTTAAVLERRHRALEGQIFRYDDELQLIRRSIRLHHKGYNKAVAGFGLTKKKTLPENNAEFASNLREARGRLGRLNADLLKLNAVSSKVNVAAARATQALAEARAAAGSARTALAKRELATQVGKANATNVLTHKMLAEIHLDISRQSTYSQEQSRGLDVFEAAVIKDSGRNRSAAIAGKPVTAAVAAKAPPRPRSAKPLVRIRFTKPNVDYKAELYRALQAALKKRPGLAFDVVGVAPSADRRQSAFSRAQSVMFTMAEMGVPPDRMTVTSETGGAKHDEVRIFVR